MGGSYASAEMQLAYSTAPADWAKDHSWSGSNANEEVLDTPQGSRTVALPLDAIPYPIHNGKEDLPLCKGYSGCILRSHGQNEFHSVMLLDLEVLAMNENSTFSKALGLEPHHYVQFSVTSRTFVGCVKILQLVHSTVLAD